MKCSKLIGRRLTLWASICLCLAGCDKSQETRPANLAQMPDLDGNRVELRAQVELARDRLSRSNAFIDAPDNSEESEAIHRDLVLLLESDDPEKIFTDLAKSINRAAALYGLVGLYFCSPIDYRETVNKKIADAGDLPVLIKDLSCVTPDATGELMKEILKTEGSALFYYGESIPEYCARKEVSIQKVKLDFYGGGIPLRWMDPSFIEVAVRQSSDLDVTGGVPFNVDDYLSRKEEFNRMWHKATKRAMMMENQPTIAPKPEH